MWGALAAEERAADPFFLTHYIRKSHLPPLPGPAAAEDFLKAWIRIPKLGASPTRVMIRTMLLPFESRRVNDRPHHGALDAIRARVEDIVPQLAASAAEHDRTGEPPAANLARIADAGLLRLVIPRLAGGYGHGLGAASEVIGRIAEAEPASALILAMHYLQHGTIGTRGFSGQIIERIRKDAIMGLSLINALRVEPELGTPMRGGIPATVLKPAPNGWRLSGHKIFSTGIPLLSWLAVWAATDEPQPRIGTALVRAATPGIRIVETWRHHGMRATASHDVIFQDVFIPAENVGELRPANEPPARDAQQAIWSSLLIAAVYDGIARSARRWFLDFLRERVPANLGKPLATLPRFQEIAGEIETLLAINHRLIRTAAAEADAGDIPDPREAGAIKVTVTGNAISAVEAALKATGNPGLSRDNPLERHYRDVLCGRVHSPQEDSVRIAAGRGALQDAGS